MMSPVVAPRTLQSPTLSEVDRLAVSPVSSSHAKVYESNAPAVLVG